MNKIYHIYLNTQEVRQEIDTELLKHPTLEGKIEEIVNQVRFLQNPKLEKYFKQVRPLSLEAYEELTKMILEAPQAEEIE